MVLTRVQQSPEPLHVVDDANYSHMLEDYYRFGLEDVDEVRRGSKGKGTIKTDAELALELFEEDAAEILASVDDWKLARSIHRAMETDGALLAEFIQTERREQEDHDLARSLSSGGFLQLSPSTSQLTSQSTFQSKTQLSPDSQIVSPGPTLLKSCTRPSRPVAGSSSGPAFVRSENSNR
ncbi:hypothetical protein EW145_g367 [Phellinidium pouzarii]|uniref:Uncharacterized protein n=1 Tax=Phellinidium pouzarii TaxID=167371 RepID=A0A4S4LP20_9AGAM|nr:hypothetical protein EW145_g367 [Phellinidium pouzarii]